MDIVNLLVGIACLIVIVGGLWLLFGGPMSQPDTDLQLKKFDTLLAGLEHPVDNYRFYEPSHKMWTATTPEAIRKNIRSRCKVQPGINAHIWSSPTFFHYKVDESEEKIYFATSSDNTIDWNRLPDE